MQACKFASYCFSDYLMCSGNRNAHTFFQIDHYRSVDGSLGGQENISFVNYLISLWSLLNYNRNSIKMRAFNSSVSKAIHMHLFGAMNEIQWSLNFEWFAIYCINLDNIARKVWHVQIVLCKRNSWSASRRQVQQFIYRYCTGKIYSFQCVVSMALLIQNTFKADMHLTGTK